ncbi:MAG TPA: hypothetical protein VFX52_13920 [Nocardioidaceae bacterium]|jgi:hypothetical protein|nr:hypothetical protein [Nocardioidaceae bacterium]
MVSRPRLAPRHLNQRRGPPLVEVPEPTLVEVPEPTLVEVPEPTLVEVPG